MAINLKNRLLQFSFSQYKKPYFLLREYTIDIRNLRRTLSSFNKLNFCFPWTLNHINHPASIRSTCTINQVTKSGCLHSSLLPVREYSTRLHSYKLWTISDPVSNPLSVLNEQTAEPVLPPGDHLFSPLPEEVQAAQAFFRSASRDGNIKVEKGVVNLEYLPTTEYPEVAFLGRSNVGKSSLIKSIFNSQVKVSVSRKPGHTRVLKFYHVDKKFSLVDMPGYGHNMPEYFVESMEEYLKSRKQLNKVFLLVEGKLGLTQTDHIAIEMMEEFSKPYVIVFTKIDRTSPASVIQHVLNLRKQLGPNVHCCFPQPFLTSSPDGWGIALLQSFITYITGAQQFKSI